MIVVKLNERYYLFLKKNSTIHIFIVILHPFFHCEYYSLYSCTQWDSAILNAKIKLSSKSHFSLWNFHKKMNLWVFIFQIFLILGHFPVNECAQIPGVCDILYYQHLHLTHFYNWIMRPKIDLFGFRKLNYTKIIFWNISKGLRCRCL